MLFLVLAIYLVALGYVPFLALLHTYNTALLLWCLMTVGVVVLFAFMLLRLKKLHFLIFTILLATLHLAIFYVPDVRTAFDIDFCLDSGGAWRDGSCQKGS